MRDVGHILGGLGLRDAIELALQAAGGDGIGLCESARGTRREDVSARDERDARRRKGCMGWGTVV